MTFSRFVDDLLERQATGDEPVTGAITISTIHAAKGLEWDSVHVIGLSEGLGEPAPASAAAAKKTASRARKS